MKSRSITRVVSSVVGRRGRVIGLAAIFLPIAFSACAANRTRSGFEDVRDEVFSRTGHHVQWRGDSTDGNFGDDSAIDSEIRDLISHPMTVDQAVECALLNNRSLQATFEDLGIAQADLAQAGLLKNPIFSAGIRLPDRSPKRTYLDFSVEEDFIDILLLPARKRLAQSEFEGAKARVAGAVIELAVDTRKACFEYQTAEQQRELRVTVLAAQGESLDMARRLYSAGNINDLAMLGETSQYDRVKIELSTAQAKVIEAREHLNDLMGLWGSNVDWTLPGRLDDLPSSDVDPRGLESLAFEQRADLKSARQAVVSSAQTLGFANDLRFLSSLQIGPEAERETDGQWRIGPSFSVPIPLFDQGQATVSRAKAVFRQNQQRYVALAVTIRTQVRLARQRMSIARQRVNYYQHDLLPVQEKLVQQMLLQYNGMLVGAFQLLQAKRDQIEAGSGYIEALHDFWCAQTDLERAVGGRLPALSPPTTKNSSSQPATLESMK